MSIIAAGMLSMLVMSVAHAKVYTYNYDYESADSAWVTSMKGTFTTASPWTAGGVEITGMTGTLGPINDSVLAVIENPSFPAESYSTSGYFIYDDVLSSAQPQLTNGGVLFYTTNGGGAEWNLFSNGPTSFQLYNSNGHFDYGTLSVSAVPEASTWAMMALGFVALGYAGHRKARDGRAAFCA
jgi:hypothetical protein